MKLGLSTYSLPWAFGVAGYEQAEKWLPADLIAYAAANNIRYIQIGDNYPLHLLGNEQLKDLCALANSHEMFLETGMRKLERANVLNYLNIARTLGSSFLRVVIDDHDFHPSENDIIAAILELLPDMKRMNMRMAIENHDRLPSQTLLRIIDKTDQEYVGICLDTANSFGALEGTYETVRLLAPHTLNLHIKDINIRRHAHKMGFSIEGAAAGTGMLNIPWILQEVEKYGRCETVILEVWSSFSGNMHQTLQTEMQMANKSIQYLKTITG